MEDVKSQDSASITRKALEDSALARRVGIFALIGASVAAIVGLNQFRQHLWLLGTINFVLGGFLVALRYWTLNRKGSAAVPANVAIGAGVAGIIATSVVAFAVGDSIVGLWAFVLIPLVAGYVLGTRAALVWGGISIAVLAIFHGLEIAQGTEFPSVPPVNLLFYQAIIIAAAVAFAIAARRIYDRQFEGIIQRERRLEEYSHQLEEASRAKSEFMSHMSHELRTPLNVIMGFAQMLYEKEDDPHARAQLGHIADAGRHLLSLVNEALEIDRIERGRLELESKPVAVSAVVTELIGMIEPMAIEHNVSMHAPEPVGGRSPAVLADRKRVGQVLLNLVSNAVKYNKEGGRVVIAAREDGDRVQISIKDSGPGIPAAQLEMLFEPFERVGDMAVEGSGLGLTVSKALIEAMGGEITVESEVGLGSKFTIWLPAADEAVLDAAPGADSDAPQAHDADGDIPPHVVTDASGRLLYIEDNPDNIMLFEAIASQRPQVTLNVATRGEDGLKQACREHPDMIVLDLHLPDIAGDKLLRRLRHDPRTAEIPVVVLSADATDLAIHGALDAGAIDYLTKPLDVSTLLGVLDDCLGAPSA